MTIQLQGKAIDADQDNLISTWTVYQDASEYSGEYTGLRVWHGTKVSTSFTVPSDAEVGDYFNLILTVKDTAKAPTCRYAQVIVTVTE